MGQVTTRARSNTRRLLGALTLAAVLTLGAGACASSPSTLEGAATGPAGAPSTAPTDSSSVSTPSPDPSAPGGTGAASPAAAPSTDSPVVVEELGRGEQDAAVDVEVAGPTQVAFRRITIKPGGGTGPHCHYGQLVAVVEKGVFTHYAPIYPTGVHVYQAGDSIVEGASYVHEGKNEGNEDLVLLVTYVIPEGEPLSETDLAKCGF